MTEQTWETLTRETLKYTSGVRDNGNTPKDGFFEDSQG